MYAACSMYLYQSCFYADHVHFIVETSMQLTTQTLVVKFNFCDVTIVPTNKDFLAFIKPLFSLRNF
jgi:hypothetical protein